MLYRDFRNRLRALGHEVDAHVIKWAEKAKHIPPVPRNYRGFRCFEELHVQAMDDYMKRRSSAPQLREAVPA